MAKAISPTEKRARRTLGRNVRHLRTTELGIGQQELAAKAKLKGYDISNIERGLATPTHYEPICAALGYTLKALTEEVIDGAEPLPRRKRKSNGKKRKCTQRTKEVAEKPVTQKKATFQVDQEIALTLGSDKETVYVNVSGVEFCISGPAGKKVQIDVT